MYGTIYLCIYICMCIHVHKYRDRERENDSFVFCVYAYACVYRYVCACMCTYTRTCTRDMRACLWVEEWKKSPCAAPKYSKPQTNPDMPWDIPKYNSSRCKAIFFGALDAQQKSWQARNSRQRSCCWDARAGSWRESNWIVWQCVAVCCSVLQCVAVCCSLLQFVAVCCSVSANGTRRHTWMSHRTHMDESWRAYEWVMAHTWMSYGTHMDESWHTLEWGCVCRCMHSCTDAYMNSHNAMTDFKTKSELSFPSLLKWACT